MTFTTQDIHEVVKALERESLPKYVCPSCGSKFYSHLERSENWLIQSGRCASCDTVRLREAR